MRLWHGIFTLTLSLHGCQGATGASEPVAVAGDTERAFAAPQGLAAAQRWLIATSSAFEQVDGERRWGPGFVTLIDRETNEVVRRIDTTQPNPADIAVVGDTAYIVNSGTFAIDDQGLATVTTGGGVDVLDLAVAVPPAAMSHNIPLPRVPSDGRIGGYGSIAISPDGRWAYVGSGTRGDVFQIDLFERRAVRGPDNPIAVVETPAGENGLTRVRRIGDKLAVLDFNSDSLCLATDWSGGLRDRACQPIGVSAELLEGPIDLVPHGKDGALVLMTIANSVYEVRFRPDGFAIDHEFASTGLACNRIAIRDPWAYVVNSSSNNLQRIDLRDRSWDLPFAVFPEHANPFDLALSDDNSGPTAWVSLFGADQLARVDLESGEVLQTIGPEAGGDVPLQPASPRPDACSLPPAAGDKIVGIGQVLSVRYGAGAGTGQARMPATVRDGPNGAGSAAGAIDGVLALGSEGEIIVDFGDRVIVDGPGADFIVFENAFVVAPYQPFAEPALVAVSEQSTRDDAFVEFPCDLDQREGDSAAERWPFAGCAGVRPVYASVERGCIDPADPAAAGGDPFDLADLGLQRARYLRIRDAGVSASGSASRGFDLDAVVLIHHAPASP